MNKFIVLASLLLMITQNSYAGSGGRSGFVDISSKKIQLISNDSFNRLYVYEVTMVNSTCDSPTPTFFFDNNILAKEIYSMILTAKATGKSIEFIAPSCKSINGRTYPSVTSAYLN